MPGRSGDHIDQVWEISPREVRRRLDARDANLLLLDCRTAKERLICFIEGSLHVPMEQLASHLERLRDVEEQDIVVYCHHGRRSLAMTAALRKMGFESVRSLAGGIDRWSLEIDPAMPRY
jgi:rhodanese-related sulfurtransferase